MAAKENKTNCKCIDCGALIRLTHRCTESELVKSSITQIPIKESIISNGVLNSPCNITLEVPVNFNAEGSIKYDKHILVNVVIK